MNEAGGVMPPVAEELEASVLGSAMIEEHALQLLLEQGREDFFFREKHRWLFAAMQRLSNKGKPVDMLSVSEEVRREHPELHASEVTEVTRDINPANQEYYLTVIREYAVKRSVIARGSDWVRAGYGNPDVYELMGDVESGLQALQRMLDSGEQRGLPEVVDAVMAQIAARAELQGLVGLDTGLADLNEMLGGLQKSDLVILAARPGMGKTAFSLHLAQKAAETGVAVGFFSLEMSEGQLVERLLAQISGVSAEVLRKGMVERAGGTSALVGAAGRLKQEMMMIDDRPGLSITEIRAKAKRWKREFDIQLLVVDYIQLAAGERSAERRRSNENREQEVSQISRGLKGIAKELDVPVLALSQLSRAVESRGGDKRPMLSDLRESGSIEQDADQVLFLYRPEYYKITVDDEGRSTLGLCEVIIAKNRHGALGTVLTHFDAPKQRFYGWTYGYTNDTNGGYNGDEKAVF